MKKTSDSNDSTQPAAKADIAALQTEFKSDIKALQAEFKADLKSNIGELATIMTEGITFLSNGQEDRKDFQKLKQRVDLSAVKPSFEP